MRLRPARPLHRLVAFAAISAVIVAASVFLGSCASFTTARRVATEVISGNYSAVGLARDGRWLTPTAELGATPDVILGDALAELESRGRKPIIGMTGAGRVIPNLQKYPGLRTFTGYVVWPKNWEQRTVEQKWRLAVHELTHARQQDDMGAAVFLALYAIPEYRWAIELQASRADLVASKHLGRTIDPEYLASHVLDKLHLLQELHPTHHDISVFLLTQWAEGAS